MHFEAVYSNSLNYKIKNNTGIFFLCSVVCVCVCVCAFFVNHNNHESDNNNYNVSQLNDCNLRLTFNILLFPSGRCWMGLGTLTLQKFRNGAATVL